jgi:hypothetical protein
MARLCLINTKHRQYYERTRDQRRTVRLAYYERNREKMVEYGRQKYEAQRAALKALRDLNLI